MDSRILKLAKDRLMRVAERETGILRDDPRFSETFTT
jgi:hypothetical protein